MKSIHSKSESESSNYYGIQLTFYYQYFLIIRNLAVQTEILELACNTEYSLENDTCQSLQQYLPI